MAGSVYIRRVLSLLLAGGVLLLTGCAGLRGTSTQSNQTTGDLQTSVQHIVIMMQENRSFDHYFGHLNDYRGRQGLSQDVDGTPPNVSIPESFHAGTAMLSPFEMVSMCVEDLSSSWLESHYDLNVTNPNNPGNPPPMNGFAEMAGGFAFHEGLNDIAGKRAMGYYTDKALPFYYWAATQFATSDRWFSPAPTRTQPNRMYLLAATSQGFAYPPTSPLTSKTIFQLLQENNITWKVYVTNNWKPGATGDTYMNYFPGFTNQHIANFADAKQFATDAQNGTLPQVALIESGYESGQDEHPLNPVDQGAAYAESFVTALMNSPSWKNSVFFLTFDEGGGFYDHVPPAATVNPDGIPPQDLNPGDPQGDFTITGFRVPLMVLSPFAKPHFVSHTTADFTAMLKFIETRFNLSSLNKRDAAQPDLTEFFDWSSPNLSPGTPPAQPTGGPCYFDQLP